LIFLTNSNISLTTKVDFANHFFNIYLINQFDYFINQKNVNH
jgi:hypothetical protein